MLHHIEPEKINSQIAKKASRKQVYAFYIHHTNITPDEWMVALGKKLQERGHYTVGLLTENSASRMDLSGLDTVFEVRPEDVQHLDAINCFIATDFEYQIRYPQSARVLGVTHACGWIKDPREFLQGATFIGSFDGHLLGFPFMHRSKEISGLFANWTPPQKQWRDGADYCLLGYGYPKLCMMREKHAELRKKAEGRRSICFAPTDINYAPYKGGDRLKQHGKRLIRIILENFPEHNLIFRPTPLNYQEELILELKEEFQDNPRFIYDDATSYLETFAKSDAMISDMAHIVSSYTAITGRPGIFFQPWQKENYSSRQYPSIANSYTNLIKQIKKDIADPGGIPLNDGFLPVDHELDRLADDLPDFIKGNYREDWLVISRKTNTTGATPMQVINAISREWPGGQISYADIFTYYFLDPLLAVFALHLHKARAPETQILNTLAKLLNLPADITYTDIENADIAKLYLAHSARREEQLKTLPLAEKAFYMALSEKALHGCDPFTP